MEKSKTAYKLLTLLADGDFHSGQALGKALGITRSGVWKAIKQLQALNIEIHAVTGKGYRIPDGLEFLDETAIHHQLKQTNANKLDQILLLSSIESTNSYLLDLAKTQRQHVIMVSAEHQTAGRGRSGKSWTSSYASSLYQSLLWPFNKDPCEIVGLSLAIGVCILRTLARYGISEDLQLKWPNDILWRGKKLAGILIDMIAEPHGGKCAVIVGIGLNLNIPYQLGKTINQPWADIATITQTPVQRNRLAGLLLDELMTTLDQFANSGLAPFLAEWSKHDAMIGKQVNLSTHQGVITGTMQGISATGELILLTKNNERRHFLSGEVSLRLSPN